MIPKIPQILVMILTALSVFSCTGESGSGETDVPYSIDHTQPENIVLAIPEIVNGKGPDSLLATLCDPMGESNMGARRICDEASGFDSTSTFFHYFHALEMEESYDLADSFARIPVRYGPELRKQDTMVLVNRGGNWYLYSF